MKDLHPVELTLLVVLLLLEALKPLLACVIALCLVLLGWRPVQKAQEQAPVITAAPVKAKRTRRAAKPRTTALQVA